MPYCPEIRSIGGSNILQYWRPAAVERIQPDGVEPTPELLPEFYPLSLGAFMISSPRLTKADFAAAPDAKPLSFLPQCGRSTASIAISKVPHTQLSELTGMPIPQLCKCIIWQWEVAFTFPYSGVLAFQSLIICFQHMNMAP